MFCPQCATQNLEGAHYCRSCGVNISLIPQALKGELTKSDQPQWPGRYSRRRRHREPTIEEAIQGITMGVAFVVVALLVARFAPAGSIWWFWMLIPAFGCFAKGFAALARLRTSKSESSTFPQPQLNTVRQTDLPAPTTGGLIDPVPSVTEGTTRHLGTDASTHRFDYSDTQKPS